MQMTKTKMTDEEAAARFEDGFEPDWENARDRSEVADIEQAVAARQVADRAIEAAVRRARRDRVPWTAIAAALGVSHQAAMKRFKDRV